MRVSSFKRRENKHPNFIKKDGAREDKSSKKGNFNEGKNGGSRAKDGKRAQVRAGGKLQKM